MCGFIFLDKAQAQNRYNEMSPTQPPAPGYDPTHTPTTGYDPEYIKSIGGIMKIAQLVSIQNPEVFPKAKSEGGQNISPVSKGGPEFFFTYVVPPLGKNVSSLREWSFINGRGCWEILARVPGKKPHPPLARREKHNPPSTILHISCGYFHELVVCS